MVCREERRDLDMGTGGRRNHAHELTPRPPTPPALHSLHQEFLPVKIQSLFMSTVTEFLWLPWKEGQLAAAAHCAPGSQVMQGLWRWMDVATLCLRCR